MDLTFTDEYSRFCPIDVSYDVFVSASGREPSSASGVADIKPHLVTTREIRWAPARRTSLAQLLRRATYQPVPEEVERNRMDKAPSQWMLPLDSRVTKSQAKDVLTWNKFHLALVPPS